MPTTAATSGIHQSFSATLSHASFSPMVNSGESQKMPVPAASIIRIEYLPSAFVGTVQSCAPSFS